MKLTASLIVHEDFSHIVSAVHSLYETTRTACEVYITINKGNRNEIDALRAAYPDVHILVNSSPQGFAANHNQIMRLAQTEYVALLNDDILLHMGALDTLVAYLQKNPQTGLVGPSLKNPDGTQQVSVYSDPTLLRMLYKISGLAVLTHQESLARRWLQKIGVARLIKVESLRPQTAARSVPVIKGAVMVVRRAAYLQVGLMDEATLAFGEEPDWHLRMRKAGWQVAHVPEAKVTHFGIGHARLQLAGQMLVEDRKAILNYFLKHRPRWEGLLIRYAITAIHTFSSIMWFPFSQTRSHDHYRAARIGATWQRPT